MSFLSSPTFQNIFGGLFRHFLTIMGGALAAKGYLEAGLLDQAVGAGMTLMGTAWSVINKTAETVVVVTPATVALAKQAKAAGKK